MKELIVSKDTFTYILQGLIASGVTFSANENDIGLIIITFTGGY